MNIGKRLKAYREYHQLTQEDLATKAGVNEKYYGRIERNESCPTVDKLEKICTALGIELSELFLYHTRHDGRVFWLDQRIANATVRGLQNDIDIHFNRNALLDVWGDRIFEKCGIRRDEEGDGGKTLEIRGKRRLSARDGGANYQQS